MCSSKTFVAFIPAQVHRLMLCCLTRGCSALRASGVHLHSTSTSKPATQTRNEGLENGCCQVRWMLHLAATLLMPCVNTRPMTPLCGRRKRDSIPSYHKKRRLLVVFFIASFSVFIQLAIINAVLPGVPTVLVPMRRC